MIGLLGDWANLLLRWTHFIAGIAWIGSSFYFIWLDRALTSGGFYQTEKRRPGPGEMPAVLHWFKWEALLTWVSGIALLVLVYYLSGAYLLDPAVSGIGRGAATALGIALLAAGWVCLPCHSRFPTDPTFGAAPAGVAFDTPESIPRLAERIRVRAVETRTMPFGNRTGMTTEERALLGRWIAAGAPLR